MKAIGQISILHLILLTMTCIGLKNHVTILPPLLGEVKRDGWMSVILSALIILPWLYIIVYIQKKTNSEPINVWLKEKYGKVVAGIIMYSTVGFIYLLTAFSMRETILWISATFLNYTPQLLLLFVYIIICFLLASTNIQTIVITNAFVLFFILIYGYYVAIVNMQVKDYSMLLPMFENGFSPILKGVVYPASGFIELILIVFIQHHFKRQYEWKHFFIITLILMGLTLGPLTGAIAAFGPEEAAKQKYPAYEEWGLVTLGEFIDHMDFLSIHQWLSGTFIRVGTLMYIAGDILNMTGKPKKIWLWLMPPFFFLNLILYVIDDTYFLRLNNHEFLVATVIFFLLLSFVLLAMTMKGKKKTMKMQESVMKNNGEQQGSINITINQSADGKSEPAQSTNGQGSSSGSQSNNGSANQPNNEPINISINQSNEPNEQSNSGQPNNSGSQSNNDSGNQSNNESINITINQSGQPNDQSNGGQSNTSGPQSNNESGNESINITIEQSNESNNNSNLS